MHQWSMFHCSKDFVAVWQGQTQIKCHFLPLNWKTNHEPMTTYIEERLPFWKKKAMLIPFHFNLPAESTCTCLDLAAKAVYIVLHLLIVIYWQKNSYEDSISTAMLGLCVCASFCLIDVEQKVHVQLNLLYVNSLKLRSFVWTLCYVNFINSTLNISSI